MLLCFAVAVETSGGRIHWTATLLSIAVLTLASVGLDRMLGLKATFLEVVAAALYAVVMALSIVGAWLFEPRPAMAQSN